MIRSFGSSCLRNIRGLSSLVPKGPSTPPSIRPPLPIATLQAVSHKPQITMASRISGAYKDVLIEITPHSGALPTTRPAWHVICILDKSGSMDEEAFIYNSQGQKESHGISIFGLASSAVNTLIDMMQPNDRITLITFSSTANIASASISTDENGKRLLKYQLEQIRPEGMTNLWDGLMKGLIKNDSNSNRKNYFESIFLLTDGQPNVNPPKGIQASFRDFITKNRPTTLVNTFGFGYEMDSELLRFLSHSGYGGFSFIPDPGAMATSFTHAIAKMFSTYATQSFLLLHPPPGSKILAVAGQTTNHLGNEDMNKNTDSVRIRLGSLQFDQKRHVLVRLPYHSNDSTNLLCDLRFLNNDGKYESIVNNNISQLPTEVWNLELARTEFVKTILSAREQKLLNNDTDKLLEHTKLALNSLNPMTPEIQAIQKDLMGEVSLALSRSDWFQRWGRHYLLALSHAHEFQTRTNFMDKSLQMYGGALFDALLEEANEIFCNAAPPKPRNPSAFKSRPIANMSSYHDPDNPICFHEKNKIKMLNREFKQVSEIQKGDILSNGAKVVCIVKTEISRGKKTQFCNVNNKLLITPWHPIRINHQQGWQFPIQLNKGIELIHLDTQFVYNFILDKLHIITIEEIECCTLAHGFTDNNIISHPYFGTNKIVNDLQLQAGWEEGQVIIRSEQVQRDPVTQLICQIV